MLTDSVAMVNAALWETLALDEPLVSVAGDPVGGCVDIIHPPIQRQLLRARSDAHMVVSLAPAHRVVKSRPVLEAARAIRVALPCPDDGC